jgi:hypothetical protein
MPEERERIVLGKTAPDISHLKADDLIKVMRESTAADIEKTRAIVSTFMERSDIIASMDVANVEKIAKLMGTVARGDGGCGFMSGGCC